MDKKELRKYALNLRATLDVQKISNIVIKKIINSEEFKVAKNIALYYPIRDEINLTELLKISDKNFYLPRCSGADMEFCRYISDDSLKIGMYDIKEPAGEKINPEILDIIYTPALAANRQCYRLGWGKGYYDKFFSQNNIKALKIIVVPEKLILNNFIQENCDYCCDAILSE